MKNIIVLSMLVIASVCSANAFASKMCGYADNRNNTILLTEDLDDNENVYWVVGATSLQITQIEAIASQNNAVCLQGSLDKSVKAAQDNSRVDGKFTVRADSSVTQDRQ